MSAQRQAERAYTLAEASELKGVSTEHLKRAIRATEGATLRAKKVGRRYLVTASALEEWFEALPDA